VAERARGGGGFTDFSRANAWALFDTDCSEVCAGFGSEPPWRDEKIGGA